jgi:cytochrome c oxidase subunit 4
MAHPTVKPRTYVLVYVALVGFTVLTYLSATQAHIGGWEVPIALGIAATKTILVGLFFMHLLYTNRLVWLILSAGVLFLAIMLSLTLADYETRDWFPQPSLSQEAVTAP